MRKTDVAAFFTVAAAFFAPLAAALVTAAIPRDEDELLEFLESPSVSLLRLIVKSWMDVRNEVDAAG